MNFFTKKEITKKIIISILLVMAFNFITPNYSQAAEPGGKLFNAVFEFVAWTGDLALRAMQKIFMGYGDIKKEDIEINGTIIEDNEYEIIYSPGVIFSNTVPALDINFFNPGGSYTYKKVTEGNLEEVAADADQSYDVPSSNIDNKKKELLKDSGYTSSNPETVAYETIPELAMFISGTSGKTTCEKWEYNDTTYYYLQSEISTQVWVATSLTGGFYEVPNSSSPGAMQKTKFTYSLKLCKADNQVTKGDKRQSSAANLQDTVATWYKTLRAVALVGLLSVLVYIGIRILIGSTGQEKAKYKKMIIDWVAAVCILFVLQYIMIFTLKATEMITDMLGTNVIGEGGCDTLMGSIRTKVGDMEPGNTNYSNLAKFTNVVIYLVLVIDTGIFSVFYLKRVMYMAFFTMIAPLIALTYPLDKVKDGQAQAFTTWIREYIFNALIQPMHLLLYFMFVTSAADLADENPIYAIVSIGFLIPAEKFFRKMFGFEKASSVSPVGAAAGGALVMNAINKMGQKSGKQAAGKGDSDGGNGSGSAPTRYIPNRNTNPVGGNQGGGNPGGGNPGGGNPGGGNPGGGNPGGGNPGGGNPGGGNPGGGNPGGGNPGGGNQGGGNPGGGNPGGGNPGGGNPGGGNPGGGNPGGGNPGGGNRTMYGQTINNAQYARSQRGVGLRTVSGKYFNRGNFGRNGKVWKAAGRGIRKGIVGAAGATALGTIGFAAGVATGDVGNALKFGAAGATAGFVGANRVGDKATEIEKTNRESYKEGKWGTQEYNTRNLIKQLTNDKDFNSVCKHSGVTNQRKREEIIREFYSNGITKAEDIKKSMNVRAATGVSQDAIIAAQKIRQEAEKYGMKRKDIKSKLQNDGVSQSDINTAMNLIDQL